MPNYHWKKIKAQLSIIREQRGYMCALQPQLWKKFADLWHHKLLIISTFRKILEFIRVFSRYGKYSTSEATVIQGRWMPKWIIKVISSRMNINIFHISLHQLQYMHEYTYILNAGIHRVCAYVIAILSILGILAAHVALASSCLSHLCKF